MRPLALLFPLIALASDAQEAPPLRSRAEAIPKDAVKATPETDPTPPILHSDEFERPVPLEGPVNTAGGEDSGYVTADGSTLYFFFTPDCRVPAEKQLFDGCTGIWVSRRVDGKWQEPERVVLQDPGELALDGCACVQGDTMWFGSARKGNLRGVDLWTAERKDGRWANWKNAGRPLNGEYEAGEMHVTADGKELYFHSERAGGKGGVDIWLTRRGEDGWEEPVDVAAVNSAESEGWPFVTYDGKELWFLRWHKGSPAVFRSTRVEDGWGEPGLVVSQFAGEPTLDAAGNLYFVHHFIRDGKVGEADLYVARKKK